MTRVTVQDCRALKYCSRGMRDFFTRHGIDWLQFVREGVDAGELPQDDAMARDVIAQAKQREAGYGQQ